MNNVYEVHRDANGDLQCSAHTLPSRFKYVVRFQIYGEAEIIEGERKSYADVWMFYANPQDYPSEHEDIYGKPIDAETVDEHCYKFIRQKCQRLYPLTIDRF